MDIDAAGPAYVLLMEGSCNDIDTEQAANEKIFRFIFDTEQNKIFHTFLSGYNVGNLCCSLLTPTQLNIHLKYFTTL